MEEVNYVGLKDWDLFKNVDLNILSSYRLCHIYSESRSTFGAIYIDHRDKAFARGYNDKLCKLGTPNVRSGSSRYHDSGFPEKAIPELSDKNIKTIATGYRHGAALSESGKVFFWGLDLSCADFSSDKVVQHPIVINGKLGFAPGERGKQISCSGNALAVITHQGRLIVKGFVEGSDPSSYIYGEVLLTSSLGLVLPMIVVGGGWHFAVLSTSRQLYTFGDGTSGALGYEWNRESDGFTTPRKVIGLPQEPVGHVACSQSATLVYLQPWSLYIFGDNSHGRLGLPSTKSSSVFLPTKINLMEPVQTVHASLYNSIFYATTVTPTRTIRWGYDASLLQPQVVESKTRIGCFANRALPLCALDSAASTGSAPVLFVDTCASASQLQEFCDDSLFSDVLIRLRDDTTFQAHRCVLYSRSDHFKMLLQPGHFAEGQSAELDMTFYDPVAYRAYLRYVYKGSIDELNPDTLAHLYMIADEYLETKLLDHCYEKFKSQLNVSTAGEMYQAAKSSGCLKFTEECFKWAVENMTTLIDLVKQRDLQKFVDTLLSF